MLQLYLQLTTITYRGMPDGIPIVIKCNHIISQGRNSQIHYAMRILWFLYEMKHFLTNHSVFIRWPFRRIGNF